MKKRILFWTGAFLVVLAGALLLVPGTSFYLPNLIVSGGYHDGRSTKSWIRTLDSDDPELRGKAIFALGAIGPQAAAAVQPLAAILTDDEDPDMRHQAALALSKMAPASEAAIPALSQAIEDQYIWVRVNAAIALSRMGAKAHPAIPNLIVALGDKTNQAILGRFTFTVQERMAVTLGQASAGRSDGVAPLHELLKSATTPTLRIAAARALGEIGPPAAVALPDLQALLEGKNAFDRETIRRAVAKIEARPVGES